MQNGRSEEEVLTELGDPLLIAKTLMDVQETQEEYSRPETNVYEERGGQESGDAQRELHRMEIKTRGGCLLAAVIFVVVVAMILWAAGTVLIHLLPILIPAEKENNKTEKWGQIPEKHGFRQRERPVGELLAFRGEYK